MIDVALLADPARCPDCTGALGSPLPAACPACALPLFGPLAADLWQVSRQAKQLLCRREQLLRQLRVSAAGEVEVSRAAQAPTAVRVPRPEQPPTTPGTAGTQSGAPQLPPAAPDPRTGAAAAAGQPGAAIPQARSGDTASGAHAAPDTVVPWPAPRGTGRRRGAVRHEVLGMLPTSAHRPADRPGHEPAGRGPAGHGAAPFPGRSPDIAAPGRGVSHPGSAGASPEVGRRRVARFILGTGVVLLIVAAIAFVAVTWQRSGTGGRAIVMALLLALSVAGAVVAERRDLPLTAEALGAVSVALGLLDGYAAYAADLAGLRGVDGAVVTAVTTAAVGCAAWAGGLVLGLRSLRVSAALLLQAPIPLLSGHLGTARGSFLPLAVGFAAQAVAEVALLRWAFRTRSTRSGLAAADQRAAARGDVSWPGSPAVRITLLGACAYWVAAFVLTLAESGGGAAPAVMVGVAVTAGLVARLLRTAAPLRHVASGACAAALYAAIPMTASVLSPEGGDSDLSGVWAFAGMSALSLVTVLCVYAVPRAYRPGPLAVLAVPFSVGGIFAVASCLRAALSPLLWAGDPWTAEEGAAGARDLLAPGQTWDWTAAPLVVVPLVGLTALLAARLLGRGGWWRRLAAGTAAAEAVVLPTALDFPLPPAVGCAVAVGTALALGAARLAPQRTDDVDPAAVVRCAGLATVASGLLWSLAQPGLSVATWGAVAVLMGVLACAVPAGWRPAPAAASAALAFADAAMAMHWAEVDKPLSGMVLAVAASVVVGVGVAAVRRRAAVAWPVVGVAGVVVLAGVAAAGDLGDGRPWTFAVALGAASGAALAGALLQPPAARPWWAGVSVAATVATAGAAAYSVDRSGDWAAAAAGVAAALILAGAPAATARRVSLRKGAAASRRALSVVVESVAGLAGAWAAVASAEDARSLAVALGVGAVATASRLPAGRSAGPVVWGPMAAGLLVGACAASAAAAQAGAESTALVAVSVAAVLYAALPWLPAALPGGVVPTGLTLAAAATCGVGATIAVHGRVWLALGVTALACVAAAVAEPHAVRRDARAGKASWIAGAVLLPAAYWTGLGQHGVAVPEAYTLPVGVLLVVGGWWLRRGGRALSSWPAYGPGLAAVLLPSLPQAVADDAVLRPAALGVAAFACLLGGARFRLQAPLLLGAGTLSVVAVFQLSAPVLAAYHALPRWAVLASAGLALIVLGAGYERRLRDLARLGRAVRGLD
jgi:hypothetical protein